MGTKALAKRQIKRPNRTLHTRQHIILKKKVQQIVCVRACVRACVRV